MSYFKFGPFLKSDWVFFSVKLYEHCILVLTAYPVYGLQKFFSYSVGYLFVLLFLRYEETLEFFCIGN